MEITNVTGGCPADIQAAIEELGLQEGEYTVELWVSGSGMRTHYVKTKTTSYQYRVETEWHAHEDFGLVDAKGRKVGMDLYLYLNTCRGVETEVEALVKYDFDEKIRVRETLTRVEGKLCTGLFDEDGKSTLSVMTEVTRDGKHFGASQRAVECGFSDDPKAINKARKTLVKKLTGAKKRYTKQFAA